MNLFKRLFTRTKPKTSPLSTDPPPSVTPPPTGAQEPASEPPPPEDSTTLTGTAEPGREALVVSAAPRAATYAGDDDEENPDDADAEGEDPTLGSGETLKIDLPKAGELLDARFQAERLALAGSHRITPNDPAGPGSLAEALGRLEAEGRVYSEVVDDPEGGFYILYQPVG